jgi:hypothetical protein
MPNPGIPKQRDHLSVIGRKRISRHAAMIALLRPRKNAHATKMWINPIAALLCVNRYRNWCLCFQAALKTSATERSTNISSHLLTIHVLDTPTRKFEIGRILITIDLRWETLHSRRKAQSPDL